MGNSAPISEKIDHPRLGPVSVLQVDGQPAMQYVVSVHHEQAQKQWEDVLKDFRGRKEYQCMFLPSSFEVEKVPCGISRNLKAIYPYFPFSLKSEIENRVGLEAPFEEKELQYLLFELLDLAKEFEKTGQKAGNIKPDNILINNEGEVSIITRHSYPGFVEAYASALYDKEPSFLSPEEIKQLETGDQECTADPSKAEAFSIGLTILSAGLLDNFDQLYNFKQSKFDTNHFQSVLLQWKQNPKYSGFFKLVVERLVALDPQERVSPGEMRAYLSPYEQNIRTLDSYQPNYQLSETNLYQYRQNKNKKPKLDESEVHGEKGASKGIRQLGAKFSKRESNRDSAQLDKTATKTGVSYIDRSNLTNVDSAKTTRDPLLLTQPISQYVIYKPAPTVTFTTHPPFQPGGTYPTGLTYTVPSGHSNPITQPPYTTHYSYVYPQQPPQPLASTTIPKPDLTKKEQTTVETVQQMLKEFKAELSGQKPDKPQQQSLSIEASPEADHQQTVEEK